MRAELPGGHSETARAQPVDKMPVQIVGAIRGRCFRERWPVALTRIAIQRKLRDHQQRAADIGDGAVHLALGIGKDPQVPGLVGQEISLVFVIDLADAKQHAQACADLPNHRGINGDLGLRNSLNNDAHG